MEEERYNKIIDISFKFGVRIVKLFQYLVDNNVNYAIPNQILKRNKHWSQCKRKRLRTK